MNLFAFRLKNNSKLINYYQKKIYSPLSSEVGSKYLNKDLD